MWSFKFNFYGLSLYKDKLIQHWLDFYWQKSANFNHRYRISVDEWLVILIMFVFALRGLVANLSTSFVQSRWMLIYTGCIFNNIHGDPFHVETLFILWSSNYFVVVLATLLFCRKRFRWLAVVDVLGGQVSKDCREYS